MTHSVDNVLDEIEMSMTQLREKTRGIPAVGGIRAAHEKARKAMGELLVAITDARSKVPAK